MKRKYTNVTYFYDALTIENKRLLCQHDMYVIGLSKKRSVWSKTG